MSLPTAWPVSLNCTMVRLSGTLRRCADPESRGMATKELVLGAWERLGKPLNGLDASLLMQPISPTFLETVKVPGSDTEPAIRQLQVIFVSASDAHRVGVPGPNIPIVYKSVANRDVPAAGRSALIREEVNPCDLVSFEVRCSFFFLRTPPFSLPQVAEYLQLYDTWDPVAAVRLMRVFPVTTLFGMPAYKAHLGAECRSLSQLEDRAMEDAQEQFYESLRAKRWRETAACAKRRRVRRATSDGSARSTGGSVAPRRKTQSPRAAAESHATLQYSEDRPEDSSLARWLFGRKEYWHGGQVEEEMLAARDRGDLLPTGTPIIVMHQKQLRLDRTCVEFDCGRSDEAMVDPDGIPLQVDEFCFPPQSGASSVTAKRSLVRALNAVKHMQTGFVALASDTDRDALDGTVTRPRKALPRRPRRGSWAQLTGRAVYIAPVEGEKWPYVLVCRTCETHARAGEFFYVPAMPGVNDGTQARGHAAVGEAAPDRSLGKQRGLPIEVHSPEKHHLLEGDAGTALSATPERRMVPGRKRKSDRQQEIDPRRLRFHAA